MISFPLSACFHSDNSSVCSRIRFIDQSFAIIRIGCKSTSTTSTQLVSAGGTTTENVQVSLKGLWQIL